ncbi:MAG: hypothetical protein ABIF77_17195 [bacterium]
MSTRRMDNGSSALLAFSVLCFLSGLYSGVIRAESENIAPAKDTPVDECTEGRADWIFCSGFEEGDLDLWDDWDGNPPETNLLMEDPGPQDVSGNHVMRLRVPDGRGMADLVKELPSAYDRLFVRWYVQWEPGYDFNALCHGGGLHAGARTLMGHSGDRPVGDDFFNATIEPSPQSHRLQIYSYYRGMYMDCIDPEGQCWGDMFPCTLDEGPHICEKPQHRDTVLPPVLETGQWYCIEILVDGGTPTPSESGADGIINFWVDGEEIGPWDDLWMRTSPDLQLRYLWLALFHHDEHSVEGLKLDYVVVSSSRIGCIGRQPGALDDEASWGSLKARYGSLNGGNSVK